MDVLFDRAGYVDAWPRDHQNQPHHPGGAMIIGPDGNIVTHTQTEHIRDEMIVAELDADQAKIVECRFFAGMTMAEIAEALGMSKRSVERQWTMIRAWLRRELTDEEYDS